MNFLEARYLVIGLLYMEKRVTYRRLQREFEIDGDTLEDIRDDLVTGQRLARDEDNEVLVWTGVSSQADSAVVAHGSLPPEDAAGMGVATRPAEAQRRQLTVMFCDLVGSTALSTRLDAEDLREVIAAFQERCREAIHRYEGFIARYMGDGLLVYFGYPQAHEQDAERAVRAGLDVLAAVPELNSDVGASYGVSLGVRIGVATGPVVVGDTVGEGAAEEAAVHGTTPNLAARIQGIAESNQLVISEDTRRLVAERFEIEDLGKHELKGMTTPTPLWRVAGYREADGGFQALHGAHGNPLVGRREELGLLARAWDASKAGHGQVVMVQGEAGIGKSRLIDALREQIAGEDHTAVVIRCSPYHLNTPLYPVVEHLKHAMGWKQEDSPDTRLEKLEQALAEQKLPLQEVVPLYADLFSLTLPEGHYKPSALDPRRKREATLDALVSWLLDEAERRPVLQVFEDLHWADPSTLEVVRLYTEQSPTVTMLNVLTYRPEFSPPWPMRSHITPITLNRLERPEVETIILDHARGKTLPDDVVGHIVTKADGVPLYVEELTKAVLESGHLFEEPDRFILKGSLSELSIPATLQDSLMARLDRIPTVREVAQLGAVIGREFAYEMLRLLAPLEEPVLQNGLGRLVDDELLYQRGRPPRARYIFKHALLHDAAYQSLLKRTRQQHHRRLAGLLVDLFPETIEANPEVLAHHYTEAGDHEKAVACWYKAGERARGQWAHQEAVAHLETGLARLEHMADTPDRTRIELEYRLALGSAIVVTKGHTAVEVGAAFTRARALCEQVGEGPEVLMALLGLWRFHVARSQLDAAADVSHELLSLAQAENEEAFFVIAHYTAGFTAFSFGDLEAAEGHFEESIGRYRPSQRQADAYRAAQDPGVACRAFAALAKWLGGYPDAARRLAGDAIALAEELGDLFSLGHARSVAAMVSEMCGHDAESKTRAQSTVDLSVEMDFAMWIAFGRVSRDWMQFKEQPGDPSLQKLRSSVAAVPALGVRAFQPYFDSMLARACQQAGHTDEALNVLEDGLAAVEETNQRWWEAELHRLRGEFLLSRSAENAAARCCFDKGLEVARRQQARSLELRLAVSLAKLLDAQGDRQGAVDTLRPVYERFTEGFDTVDLVSSRELLQLWGRSM